VLLSAVHHASNTPLRIRLRSAPSTTYAIDVFASVRCDPSGHGEGAKFVKSLSVTTNASGVFLGTRTVPALPLGRYVTATATDPVGNTSEFSACRRVTAP